VHAKKILCLSSLAATLSLAQPFSREIEPFPITKAGVRIAQPFAGGINTPLIEFADIDGDGDKDLFIFDNDFSVSFYKNEGTRTIPYFKLQPQTISFPSFLFWFTLVDFNGDGKYDLLCDDSSNGISYYQNEGTTELPSFTLVAKHLRDADTNVVFGGVLGKPAFADIDGDNDYDFFSSNFNGTVNFYENIGTPQSPLLIFRTDVFQNFAIINDSCQSPAIMANSLHGGSNFFFADIDGNGTQDMFIGDLNSRGLFFLQNNGTPSIPLLECTYNRYPPDNPISTSGFNVPFLLDIDDDHDLDLFVGVMIDIQRNSFLYLQNIGNATNPSFALRTKEYLSMIDVGKNAQPAFVDIDHDGDFDFFIGNLNGQLWYYRNDGTSTAPSFVYVDSTYGALSGNFSYAPAFADIDNDGDDDLFIGRFDGRIQFYRNEGTPTVPLFTPAASPIDTINVSMNAVPAFVDCDGDGDYDLFIGRANGTIRYYRNIGSATNFVPILVDAVFNGITVGENAKPTFSDVDADGDQDLFVGSASGKIFWYENVGTPTSPSFTLRTDLFGNPDPMLESAAAFCDIDGDGDADVFVGCSKGGIQFYRNQRISMKIEEKEFPHHMQLFQNYPNPFNLQTKIGFYLAVSAFTSLKVYDVFGREIAMLINEKLQAGEHEVEWDAEQFASGVYFYALFTEHQSQVKKMILLR
jgi:hypothetical protein